MLLSQMAAEAAKDYKYDIILANVNGKLTEISDMDITDEKVEFITVGETMGNEAYKRSVLLSMQYISLIQIIKSRELQLNSLLAKVFIAI